MKINPKMLNPLYKENSTPKVKRVKRVSWYRHSQAITHLFMENSDLFDTMVTQLRRVNGKKFGGKKKKSSLRSKCKNVNDLKKYLFIKELMKVWVSPIILLN